ncbi:Leucine aminopeptidase 1 [Maudiozyma exigua]|uniref:Peptide hydrolase n=1 Tax=Maudiozyma exigua TaxID=34358 RepID=A0A9P6W9V8_MAUEX|nr:Leucine aminopeptidase 1 [Kazachstania exigua]
MRIPTVLSWLTYTFSLTQGFPFEEKRILQVSDSKLLTVTESQKLSLLKRGVRFFDVTKQQQISNTYISHRLDDPVVPEYKFPLTISHSEEVKSLTSEIDMKYMYEKLADFTSFYTRYYKSEYGLQAAEWLSSQIHEIVDVLPKDLVTVEHFDHHDWQQFSILVKFKGTTSPENIIVIGSHLDSINLLFPNWLPAPGADDNGSGTITNLEALRLLSEHISKTGNALNNTIEFHFYSAEEAGLLGSLDVFSSYAALNKKVVTMLQQDMTGFVSDKSKEHVGVIVDYTDVGLTTFIKTVIDNYLSIPYIETECGYACSDHGSATKNGYPGAFVIESEFKLTNKYIHSTMDTIDKISISHMAEHTKIVLGTVLELGQWDGF